MLLSIALIGMAYFGQERDRALVVYESGESTDLSAALEAGVSALESRALVHQIISSEFGENLKDTRTELCSYLRKEGYRFGYWLTFQRETGILRVWGFDNETGRSGMRGTKVRSLTKQLSDEHRSMVVKMFEFVESSMLDAPVSFDDPFPTFEEDRPHPGFLWEFVNGRTFVSFVFAGSGFANEGLRSGDRILRVGKERIESPALFGRSIQAVRPGESLEIEVERLGDLDGQTERTYSATMQTYSDVLKKWEEPSLGEPLNKIVLESGISCEPGIVTIVAIVSAARPDDWEELYSLNWISEVYKDRVKLFGVFRGGDEAHVKDFVDRFRRKGTWIEDPSMALSRELCVDEAPRFLIIDKEGILRGRYVRGANLVSNIAFVLKE